MSTRLDIRVQGRALVSEVDANNSQISDAEFNTFIDMWQRNLAALVEWPRAEATSSTVLGQSTYGTPTDLLSFIKIFLTDENSKEYELKPTTIQELNVLYGDRWKSEDNGQPKHYFLSDSDVFGIIPPPNSTFATKTLRLLYVIVPAALTADGDTPDLPTVYHDTGQYFAAAHALYKIGKIHEGDNMLRKYFEIVKLLRTQVTKQSQELTAWRWEMAPD